MFRTMEAARLETLHVVSDPSGLQALVAIHSSRLGPPLGGCRYLSYPSEESALTDVVRLAASMSRKAALAGLPLGGGKAVILRPPYVASRAALFEAFGRFVDRLGGHFIAAIDSGTSSADMDCIARHTRHVACTSEEGDPAPHTALGVFAGIRATALARLGSDNLEDLRIAIQGLGKVGYALAEQLHAAGAELLVSDPDPGRVRLAVEAFGAHPLPCAELLCTPCDILAPCALGGVLDAHTIAHLRCAAVAGAANDQLVSEDLAEQLEARGILYAPDYVINAGGLIHAYYSHQGASSGVVAEHLLQIPQRLTDLYAHAQAEHCSPAWVAQQQADRLLYG